MKIAEIRELSTAELQERVEADVMRYAQMKLNHAISPLENPELLKKMRRDIARMKGELRSRELNK
ncbi:MAG: 50S ribosomal protein L29 [Bacteroidaceae bacterium]|jgi:large subunit ribosomal protein L29|nr:50S ribosomal protein L29 [Bacteroidaceae bacterium]MBR2318790.1 50S ribosomal protein L29 [Bacteroidaceae bacterium]MBR4988731.1 50S ribosomal protein L29 [Bacteroidaceae bacterium]